MEQLNRQTDNEQVKVAELNDGEHFLYARIEWVKLANSATGGCLVLSADVLFSMAFDEGNGNDWSKASLRKYLNSFTDGESIHTGDIKQDDLIEFERDLTTDDGMTKYGTCRDFISLYTCDEYRKFRKYIPNCGKWHWTITADSLVYSYYVRFVISGGSLNYYSARCGDLGVRPLCNLKPDILVSRCGK